MESPLNATLTYRRDLNEALAIFRIRPDTGVAPFTAGQFATIGLPREEDDEPDVSKLAPAVAEKVLAAARARAALSGGRKRVRMIRRAYSIASSPKMQDYLEFFIVLIDEGKLTPLLWKLPVGGRIFVEPEIKGEFTLDDVPAGKHLLMIATGTGLAPFLSMLDTHEADERWESCTLVHGVRHARDFAYVEELHSRCKRDSRIRYVPMVSRAAENPDWKGLTGRTPVLLEPARYREITGLDLNPADTHVFLCGNPQMIDDVARLLETRGFRVHSKKEPGNIHFERYW